MGLGLGTFEHSGDGFGFGGHWAQWGWVWGTLGTMGMGLGVTEDSGDHWAWRGWVWGRLGTLGVVALPRPTFVGEVGAEQVGLSLLGQGKDVDGRRVGAGATKTLHLLVALRRVQRQVEICRGGAVVWMWRERNTEMWHVGTWGGVRGGDWGSFLALMVP